MKKLFKAIMFLLLVSSCNYFDSNRPRIEFSGSNVKLYNLEYVKGVGGTNHVETNLYEFSKPIWKALRERTGSIEAIQVYESTDQYGNKTSRDIPFGNIDLDELKKYQSYDDFKRAGGFGAVITIYREQRTNKPT